MTGSSLLWHSARRWRWANDFLGIMPIVVLAGVLVWLAFGEQRPGPEAGVGSVEHGQAALPVLSAPPSVPVLIVAVSSELAGELRGLLGEEASLREALGEEQRLAEVIPAASEEQAELIATAARTELVLGLPFVVVVVR